MKLNTPVYSYRGQCVVRSLRFHFQVLLFVLEGTGLDYNLRLYSEVDFSFFCPLAKPLIGSLTLCGLTGQKTHQGGPVLGGSVHEEAHPCFPYFAQRTFKSIDAGGSTARWSSWFHLLITRLEKKYLQQSRVHLNLTSFLECPLVPVLLSAKVKKLI